MPQTANVDKNSKPTNTLWICSRVKGIQNDRGRNVNAMTCIQNCVKFALKCLLRDTLRCLILFSCSTFMNVRFCKVVRHHWLGLTGALIAHVKARSLSYTLQ